MTDVQTFWDLSLADLEARFAEWGQPAYRARQVWRRAYQGFASSFEEMTELPRGLRDRLAASFALVTLQSVTAEDSLDGSTRKVLWRLRDGLTIETVLMRYDQTDRGRARSTLCVSTQVGCAMACVFCATGQQGFLRHLAAGEIVEQVIAFARELRAEGTHLTNIVFMGMGEPLHNYDNTMAAVRRLNDPDGFGLGARHMTLSTVGLVPAIRRLAQEDLQVGLAVSLHAPDDDLRRRIVPTARKYTLDEILDACRYYHERTGRRVTFEYCLMAGINDSVEQATRLARRIKDLGAHVNLIPVNPTDNGEIRRPARSQTVAFQRAIQARGLSCTVRVEKGIEIAAGCGQLRGRDERAGLDRVLPPQEADPGTLERVLSVGRTSRPGTGRAAVRGHREPVAHPEPVEG